MKLNAVLVEASTPNLKELAEKLHEFSLNDEEGKRCWDRASEMFQNGEDPFADGDDEDDGDYSPDPGNAAQWFMDELFTCIHHNAYKGTIIERAGLVAELEALTDEQRQELYDSLYEGVEAGLD